MFIIALFTKTKIWKQPKCTLMDKWTSIYLSATAAKPLQSCPTLCNPIDSSPPGSSVHGVFQARILEWVAIAFSIYLSTYLSRYKYKRQFHSAVWNKEIMPFATTWLKLEGIMLTGINQRQILYDITLTWDLLKKRERGKFHRIENRMMDDD